MSSHDPGTAAEKLSAAADAIKAFNDSGGNGEAMTDHEAWTKLASETDPESVQWLLTAAMKLTALQYEAGRSDSPFAGRVVHASDIVNTVPAMLEALELELFELTPWVRLGIR